MDSLVGQAKVRGWVECHTMQSSLHPGAHRLVEGAEGTEGALSGEMGKDSHSESRSFLERDHRSRALKSEKGSLG